MDIIIVFGLPISSTYLLSTFRAETASYSPLILKYRAQWHTVWAQQSLHQLKCMTQQDGKTNEPSYFFSLWHSHHKTTSCTLPIFSEIHPPTENKLHHSNVLFPGITNFPWVGPMALHSRVTHKVSILRNPLQRDLELYKLTNQHTVAMPRLSITFSSQVTGIQAFILSQIYPEFYFWRPPPFCFHNSRLLLFCLSSPLWLLKQKKVQKYLGNEQQESHRFPNKNRCSDFGCTTATPLIAL